jgi:hypothetical protein
MTEAQIQVSIAIGVLWAIAIAVLYFEAKEKSNDEGEDSGL